MKQKALRSIHRSSSRRWLRGSMAGMTVVAAVSLTATSASAAGPAPLPVTPYSGFNSSLTRAPYVTDLTQTSAYVNWATTSKSPGSIQAAPTANGLCPTTISTWTSAATKVPTSLPGPVNPTSSGSSSSMTGWEYTVTNGAGVATNEYQASVDVTGLSAGTRYCYAVFSADASGAVDLLPSSQPDQTFTTLDAASTSSTKPVTFDVIADTGENYAYTSPTPSGDVAFPGGVNPDEASIYHQIGQSGAKFLLIAGDIAYNGGNESTYGDLEQTGTDPEVSNIFGPSYFPQTGGIPTFAADGNHGQNVTTLKTWPTPTTATSSGGTYAFDSYSGVDGISGTFPDDWYAFSTGNVRIYVIDGAWADGSSGPSGTGDATGSECTAKPSYCEGYQADADEHWQTSSPEYQWLQRDLAAHPGGVKFAVFHYPLRSDNATQPSDPYVDNSAANPNASTSLEALLAANGVDIAFNGHAHTYQRIVPRQSGQIINYVTGGGGGVLEPVLGGTTCQSLLATEDIYALGWTPSKTDPNGGTGSACGATAPQSAAQVYNFLKVTVTGDSVTVTPTNAAGQTFDQQTYTFSPPASNDFSIAASPNSASVTAGSTTTSTISTAVTSGAAQQVTLSATGAPTGANVSFNPPVISAGKTSTMTVTTTASTPGGTSPITVTGTGASAVHSTTLTLTVTSASSSGPQLVQSAGASEAAAATSLTGTFPSATKTGDLLVLSASEYTGATNHITSVIDSAGNRWTRIGAYDVSGHNSDGEMWYSADAAPVTAVTVRTASAASLALYAQEFSGVSTNSPLDVSTGSSNTGTVAGSGTTTSTVADELAVGFVAGHGSSEPITVTAPGYTSQPQQVTSGSIATVVTGYQVLAGPGAQTFSGSFTTGMYWAAGIAVFKAG
jgi:hypothetical protein